jgi:hypothetical protein
MLNPEARISQRPVVTDLAQYRRRRGLSSIESWKADREFLIGFTEYLQKRIESAELNPKELKRLSVAFDLRRIRLMGCLRSLLNEEYLTDQAALALRSAGRLSEELAAAAPKASLACSIANELVHALDAVIAALKFTLISTYRIER